MSFSFGRALQEHALKAWQGRSENSLAAQKAFYHRARCNVAARRGLYSEEMES
jgi:fructose-bisphosphate aldolase class I